ncbi:MAG: hypothetical protein JWN03_1200 [Nocardia sp.]|uniref:hypothetical protein n=1 Tax=Nocardia sp. TaxID=1821 RepID=UPI0026280A4C|nr:hypothetical protein [Nocardia sp.]MCU1640925.1 hypothetical protein [Nocardia sp.]
MTTPGIPAPDGAFVVGGTFGSDLNTDTTKQQLAAGTIAAYTRTQNAAGTQIRQPIAQVQGVAGQAVTTAQAAANDAASASEKADIAYDTASYWSLEFIVASAEVLLGVNELLLGPVLNVPDNRTALLTDIHMGLLNQPGGMSVETRKWNPTGTSYTTIHTGTLDPNVNRKNFNALTVPVLDKERFFPYVTGVVGTVAPAVLQVCVAGVFI